MPLFGSVEGMNISVKNLRIGNTINKFILPNKKSFFFQVTTLNILSGQITGIS